tara:strand:+ start:67 stop:234 length:168 start_codon:yes stop_codon:yes gene_type:complete
MERSKRSFVGKEVREKINGGVERDGNDGNSGDRRVLCNLVSFELRQFNRIVEDYK